MQLNVTQLKQFDEEGWIFLPDCFSPEEVALLRDEGKKALGSMTMASWYAR